MVAGYVYCGDVAAVSILPHRSSHTFETFSQSLHHPSRAAGFANASFASCAT